MNIISNVCSGAYLYKKMGCKYNNPFMWSVLHYNDLKELCTNFENIDFDYALPIKCERVKDAWSILIDEKILVEYVHNLQNPNYSIPTKVNDNVLYNKMWKYTFDKYMERLARMKDTNENPVFLIMDFKDDLTYENTLDLIKNTKYKMIVFTNRDYKYKNESVMIIKTNLTDSQQFNYPADEFINKYYNNILRFL